MKEIKPMYNSEEKEQFIEYYMSIREVKKTTLTALFRKIAPFEMRYAQDCCYFNKEMILEMYMNFNAKSVQTLLNNNSTLKSYCVWKARINGNENNNSYAEITKSDVKDLFEREYFELLTREEIDYIEAKLYNWTDRAIVECLWEGVAGYSEKDLVSIIRDMVDSENKVLKLSNGREVQLTEKLHTLLINAFDENVYRCYGYTGRVKELYGENCLYKERDNAHAMDSDDKFFRWVYRKVQLFREHVDVKSFTMKNISMSGMCYYLKHGMDESGLDLRSFLLSEDGQNLMDKYGYTAQNRVDNVCAKFELFVI